MLIQIKKRYLIISLLIFVFLATLIFLFLKANQILPQASIHLMDDFQLPNSNDKLLIFSPHPDDESLGAGGLIIQSLKNDAKVKVVEVTDGNKQGRANQRKEEVKKALQILGLGEENIIFLNLSDGKLSQEKDLDKIFLKIIQDFQPTYVLTAHPADEHPDHSKTGQNIQKAIEESNLKPQVYEYLIHFPRYPKPSGLHPDEYLLPPARLISLDKQWFRLMLTPEEEDLKTEAILQHKSQLSFKNPVLRSLLFSFIRRNEIFSK